MRHLTARRAPYFCLALILIGVPFLRARPAADGPPEFNVREHYTKYEFRIPMRDGKQLFTSVYVPKDASHAYPFLMQRTPYSVAPYGVDSVRKPAGAVAEVRRGGLHLRLSGRARTLHVRRDVRGDAPSHRRQEIEERDVDESTDTYDTIDWLLKHVPNNNGKVRHLGHFVSRVSTPRRASSIRIRRSRPRRRRRP